MSIKRSHATVHHLEKSILCVVFQSVIFIDIFDQKLYMVAGKQNTALFRIGIPEILGAKNNTNIFITRIFLSTRDRSFGLRVVEFNETADGKYIY